MVADNVFYVCVHVCMQAFMYSLPSFAAVLLYATIAAVTEAAVNVKPAPVIIRPPFRPFCCKYSQEHICVSAVVTSKCR